MSPSLSIIVPVYNVKKYISRCVESLISQSFKDIEIILVDDGSFDGSSIICDQYTNQYDFITTIHKSNGGHASARNCGIDIARGNYIMFIDSDDFVHCDMCRLMYNAINSSPFSWVFCNMQRVNENGNVISGLSENEANVCFSSNPTYFNAFKLSLSGSVSNKIYNLKTIRNNNIRFDENYKLGEDVQFDCLYFKTCSSIQFIPSPLYFYRVVENSLTHSYHPNHLSIYIKLFSTRLPFIAYDEINEFCDIYFHYFVTLLDNTMDKRNPMSFWEKMRYNHKMMRTEEFRYCVAHSSGKNDSKLFMSIVKTHNYYLYWAFQKVCRFKDRIIRKMQRG